MPKSAIAVIFVIVIIVAVAVMIKTTVVEDRGGAYEEALKQEMEVYDVAADEVTKVSLGEWQNMSIDPETGYRIGSGGTKYTMPIISAATGKKVPRPPIPTDATPREEAEIMKNYVDEETGRPHYPREDVQEVLRAAEEEEML